MTKERRAQGAHHTARNSSLALASLVFKFGTRKAACTSTATVPAEGKGGCHVSAVAHSFSNRKDVGFEGAWMVVRLADL